MPKIVEGGIEVAESCTSTRQRLTLYFPGNDKLIDEWSNICASLSFYNIYRVLPRELDFRNNLFANMSRTMMEIIDNRLDLDLTEAELESLSTAENSTMTREIYGSITNKTQNLMHNIIRSDLVGYLMLDV